MPNFGQKNRLKKSNTDPEGATAVMIKPLPGQFLIFSICGCRSVTAFADGKTA